jgi:electron transfer flavoprotein beta subunit
MRAVVCLTSAVDSEERLEFVPGRGASNLEAFRRELSRADACALEQALRLKGARADLEVVGVTMGSEAADDVPREAIGQGADEVLRLWDDALENADAHATALILAAAARRLGADLVLCGDHAADGATGQVAGQMAEMLGWPLVANIVRLEVTAEAEAVAEQRLERGVRQRVRCALPALFTLQEGAVQPRYPRLRNRLRAKSAVVPTCGLDDLSLDAAAIRETKSRTAVLRVSPPKPTSKGIFTPDAELSPEERLAQILAGGFEQRQPAAEEQATGPLAGSPVEQAREIARFLAEGRFL